MSADDQRKKPEKRDRQEAFKKKDSSDRPDFGKRLRVEPEVDKRYSTASFVKGQGDHVVAYALIKRGFNRRALEYADDPRALREHVYRYLGVLYHLGSLSTDSSPGSFLRGSLYKRLESYLIDYEETRSPKSERRVLNRGIRDKLASLKSQSEESLSPEFDELLAMIEEREELALIGEKNANDAAILLFCDRMAKAGVRYYNRLPGVAYTRQKGESHNSRPEGKNTERWAVDRLDKAFVRPHHGARPLSARSLETLSEDNMILAMDALFDYKEVSISSGKQHLGDRSNDPDILVAQLAKHMYLFFHVYPEAKTGFDKPRVCQQFIIKMLKRDWPSMSESDRANVVSGVFQAYNKLIVSSADYMSIVDDLVDMYQSSDASITVDDEEWAPKASTAPAEEEEELDSEPLPSGSPVL